jgi:membrane-bound lytic murein transglycosylase B
MVFVIMAATVGATGSLAQEAPPAEGGGGFSYPFAMEVDERGVDTGGIAAELATVPVESVEVTGLIDGIEEAALLGYLSTLDAVDADRRIEHMELERALVAIDREELRGQRTEAQEQLAQVRAMLTELAVISYVEGGVSLAFDDEWSVADDNAEATSQEALVQVSRSQIASRDDLVLRIEGLTTEIDDRTARLESLAADILEQTARRERAAVAQVQYQADVERLTPQVGPARARAEVADLGISMVVLDAYFRAERQMAAERPSCGIEWETLAGIGRIESRHGTFGAAGVTQTGQTRGLVIGIPLDGENETREILDSDGGALDGDPEFDRAVGPMQFIPTTWQRFARDGDGNGAADPHNLYDAALSAAEYLCRGRSNLHDRSALVGAILSYNHSNAYVSSVLRWRATYAEPDLPQPLPAIPGGG